jgi:hypothetical protein
MLDFKQGRQRAINYIGLFDNIVDSYDYGIPHGIQKDAIQNAWDAKKGNKPLKMDFELIGNDKGKFFIMTDSNTCGLTGPVLNAEDYTPDLPSDYHWARFESLAFTKRDPDSIGARGQGKFVFLCESKNYKMYYDTLRDDGIYRLGATQATENDCPVIAWENEKAKLTIRELCGLEPLRNVGTRIIIVSPKDELMFQLVSGEFIRAIQETWFRAIEKKQAIITVRYFDNFNEIKLPNLYPLPIKDSKDYKVWNLGRDFKEKEIRLSTGDNFRIKRFHAVYFKDEQIPEEIQGIAIIHNGMKITSLQMDSAPPKIREQITGYIEFDKELDRELRKGENQNPNHYDLKWRKRLPKAIKNYISKQLEEFGKKKLGLNVDPRERKKRQQSNAEEFAIRELLKHARDLDLFGAKGGKVKPGGNGGTRSPKEIGISIEGISFPEPEIAPRINWGQKFEDVSVCAFNQSDTDRNVYIRCHVFRGVSIVQELLVTVPFSLNTKQQIDFDSFNIEIDKGSFSEKGEYRLNAAMFDKKTGDRIDRVSKRFWVETNPPLRSPFDREPLPKFPEPNQHRQWLTFGDINNSPVVYYNTSHPAYRFVEDDENKLQDYMFQILLEAAIYFVLNRPDKEDGKPDYHPLDLENILGAKGKRIEREDVPKNAYLEAIRYISNIRWKVLNGE